MATDKLINQTQGDDIIDALSDIADNVGNITYGPQTSADKVVSMLGYAEAAEAASINPGDTLNQAIGKLEKKANDNATNVANKIDKLTNATAGDIATVTATGEIADSTVSIADSNTGLADSDTAVPTSKTVKTYVDSTATGISRYLGTITAANQLSTSAKKGDFYVVKTAWTGVHAGDEIIAEKDNPAQTIDGTNWSLLHNEADTDTKYQFGEGTTNGTFLVTPSDTGVAQPVPIKGLGSAAYTTADTSSLTNDNNHVPTSALAKTLLDAKVPTTRKVNNKALSSDITLSASDVSAVPSGNVTTTLPASSAAASTSKVMSEKLVYDTYVQNSDFVVAEQNILYSINAGGKNLLSKFQYYDNADKVTVNADGSITLNVAASSYDINIHFALDSDGVDRYKPMPAEWVGKYFSGMVTANNALIWIMELSDDGSTWKRQLTIGTVNQKLEIPNDGYYKFTLKIAKNNAVSNYTFKPMIADEIVYDTIGAGQPPALPNSNLTLIEAEDRAGLVECVDGGAKNKINIVSPTATIGNITFTHNSDGSITVNGTANNTDTFYYLTSTTGNSGQSAVMNVGSSPCILTGCPSGGAGNTYELQLSKNSGDYRDRGTGIDIPANSSGPVVIAIRAGYAPSNLKFYPMLCTKAAFGVSQKFVPYIPNQATLSAQIEYLTPSLKSKRYVCSTTDYEQCADVAITVPANKTIQYTANLKFNNAPPRGVQVRTGTDLSNLNQVVGIQETTQNYSNLSVTGLYTNTSSSQVILYVYVKSNAVTSGGNDVVTNVFRLN